MCSSDLPIAYFLAQRSDRPVKIVMTYAEELAASNPAHPTVVLIRSGVKRDGRIVARNADRQPNFFNLDVRLVKDLDLSGGRRLTVSIEAFNLTKAANTGMDGDGESVFGAPTTTPNAVTGYYYTNATAGRPTTAPSTDRFGGPRQVQLGIRFAF